MSRAENIIELLKWQKHKLERMLEEDEQLSEQITKELLAIDEQIATIKRMGVVCFQ